MDTDGGEKVILENNHTESQTQTEHKYKGSIAKRLWKLCTSNINHCLVH